MARCRLSKSLEEYVRNCVGLRNFSALRKLFDKAMEAHFVRESA